eukprot:2077243-Amphidinium_carterae.1
MAEGAGGSKIQHLVEGLHASTEADAYNAPQQRQVAASMPPPTLTLRSDNLALPKAAAQIPLRPPVVPQFISSILEEEGSFDLPAEQCPKAPRGYWQVQNWPEVASKLCEAGLMQLCRHRPDALRTGLFGVAKKGSPMLRIIVDRRPQNSQQRRLIDIAFERGLQSGMSPS